MVSNFHPDEKFAFSLGLRCIKCVPGPYRDNALCTRPSLRAFVSDYCLLSVNIVSGEGLTELNYTASYSRAYFFLYKQPAPCARNCRLLDENMLACATRHGVHYGPGEQRNIVSEQVIRPYSCDNVFGQPSVYVGLRVRFRAAALVVLRPDLFTEARMSEYGSHSFLVRVLRQERSNMDTRKYDMFQQLF